MIAQPHDFGEHIARADELTQRFFDRIADDSVPLTEALADLDGAIEVLGRVLDLASGEEYGEIAGELGYLILVRFDVGAEDRADLEAAIRLLRHAAGEDPDLATVADLGRALASRYDLSADDADRDEAIGLLRSVCNADQDDPALLVTLAELLAARGEQHSDVADMTDAIEYAELSLALLLDDSADREPALYSLGVSHLLRADMDPARAPGDAYAAVTRLGQLRAMLAADDPWHAEVTAWYGIALTVRIGTLSRSLRVSNALRRRADEAIQVLSEAEPGLPHAHPLRLRVRFAAALMRALRSTVPGGTGEDRDLVLAELEAIGNTPGCDPAIATQCHYSSALALVTSRLDEGLWRAVTRYDYAAHKQFTAASKTTGGPAPADAKRALEHLDQIPELGAASPVAAHEILELRGWALIHQREGGPAEEDLVQAIACTEEAIRLTPDGDPDLGMRQGQLAQIRAILAEQSGSRSGDRELIEGLTAAAEKLDRDYPLRPLVLGALGVSVEAQASGTPVSSRDSTAAAELVERALRQIPSDHPARVQVLTRLGEVLLEHTVFDHSAEHLDRIRGLLQDAISHPAADDTNKAVNNYLLGMVDGAAAALGSDDSRFDAAIGRLKCAAGLVPAGHWLQGTILGAVSTLLSSRYYRGGGLEFLDASDHYARAALQAMRATGTSTTERAVSLECHLAIAPLRRRLGNLDRHEVLQLLEEAARRLDEIAAPLSGHHLSHLVEQARSQLRAVSSMLAAGVRAEDIDRASLAAAADLASRFVSAEPDVSPDRDDFPLALVRIGNVNVMQGYARRDLKLFNAGLVSYADALAAAHSAPPERQWWPNVPAALRALGSALCMRYELTGNRADLSNGITRLKDARREAAVGPRGLTSAVIAYQLATAYRHRDDQNLGDRRSAAESGLDALRDYARDVLLQRTANRAFEVALGAADKASVIARWCLDAGMAEAAVEALEMGRGMVLHAATTEAVVPALLREAGRPDLAVEWEATDPSDPAPWDGNAGPEELSGVPAGLAQAPLPSDLRQRVMAAVEYTETEPKLLTPPSAGEIADSLRAAGVDTLAYMLPGREGVQGLGVLVGADGRVRSIPLPRLEVGPRSRVDIFVDAQREWLQAERGRDETAAIPARRRWRGALADMCDWAWTAAMDKLLAAVPGAQHRPARLVLVPVGELGLVPWHAARRTVANGTRRYACQDAVISYATAARQYVTARRHIPRPWGTEPVLIAASDSGYWTKRGIGRIRRLFYPGATLLTGPEATAENIRKLLSGPNSSGISLLHVGTHAEPAEHPLSSRLRLDDNQSLSMADLLRHASRPAGTPGGLVVLAACGTDLTGRAHDEALTLATAFLALGAAGAVGTRWPVKDVPTAVFMAVLHQQLNSGHQDPAAALRATQLWMLDPGRVMPDSIDPALAGEMRTVDLDAVDTWAAYTYQGR